MHTRDITQIGGAAVLILGLLFSGYIGDALGKPDPCTAPVPTSHTVLLADRTDIFSATVRGRLAARVRELAAGLHAGDRYSIYTIEDTSPEPVWSACRPRNAEDATISTPGAYWLDVDFKGHFAGPVQALSEKLATAAQAPHSPIMETVAAIASMPTFSPSVKNRTLIIVSDMLENTAGFSQYRSGPDFQQFQHTAYARGVGVRLDGVRVRVLYITRHDAASAHQGAAHKAFWISWLKSLGADVTVEDVR
ncbi:hypothetical protein [Kordiimonas sp.]|uniref:hypothetical protein n=1 Tax=Kordiimonas sp. TaxID=1970157 RepID=UPI003A8EB49B